MVVNDLDFKRVAFPPYKADAILLVDSNAMLTLPIALERPEPKADAPKIVQRSCLIKKEKSPKGDALKSLEARHPPLVEKPFGVAVRKAAYQTAPMILRKSYYVKRIVKSSGRTEGAERHRSPDHQGFFDFALDRYRAEVSVNTTAPPWARPPSSVIPSVGARSAP